MPTISIDGRKMYFEMHGEGEPVLALGGFPLTTGPGFLNQPAALRERFRVVVFDHRGFGQSEDDGADPSTRLYAEDAARLLDAIGLQRVHLLGAGGLGACIAQHLAAGRPDLVHDLVLSAGWAAPEPYHHAQQRLMLMLRGLEDTTFYSLFTALLVLRPEHFTEERLEARAKAADSQSGTWKQRQKAHLKLLQANYEHDATGILGDIACPTLVTCGEYDLLGGPRLAGALAAAIPGSAFKVIPDIGHVYGADPAAHATYGDMVTSFFAAHPLA
ncbi:alpha/beta fold hydrolase [Devosia sp.]|uniref:alpha/beta fold hydrolase n=1 Tax=Devosia sp. TaxID=1871048 RepID=UPI002F1CAF27